MCILHKNYDAWSSVVIKSIIELNAAKHAIDADERQCRRTWHFNEERRYPWAFNLTIKPIEVPSKCYQGSKLTMEQNSMVYTWHSWPQADSDLRLVQVVPQDAKLSTRRIQHWPGICFANALNICRIQGGVSTRNEHLSAWRVQAQKLLPLTK